MTPRVATWHSQPRQPPPESPRLSDEAFARVLTLLRIARLEMSWAVEYLDTLAWQTEWR